MKRFVFASCLLGALVTGEAVAAAELETGKPGAEDPTLRDVKPERRNGLTLGVSGGFALAGASGYPNNARLLGEPDFYSSSPLLAGWSTSFFLMGAFNDYVSFGPMVTIATFESEQWKSTGWAAGFRGEFFPLVKLVPLLADTAVYAQLGFGTTELRAKGPYPSAGGEQSFLGIGLHHEWRLARLLGGHASAGPYIEYDAIRSPSAERHWATAGLRVVWYGGGVKLDR
ncbi:MAG: hypothetical protein J0I07_20185 [Myxococcales bacterium]|nr:hypothetical protein [Myxococcales bacterium]